MGSRLARGMRGYWDERARLNAAYYVDTSLDYAHPDMERFFETGRRIVQVAYDEAPVRPSGSELAVEIGSGLGRMCAALAERFDHVVGFDISAEMLRQARDLVPSPKVEFRATDGSSLPDLEPSSVDFVFSFTVFQHLPSTGLIADYLAAAGQVLRPGGVIAFQWNNQPGQRSWPLRRAVRAARARAGRGDPLGRDAVQFLGTPASLRTIDRALARAGLVRVGLKDPGQLFTWAWAARSD